MSMSSSDINVPSIVAQVRAVAANTSALQSKWLMPWCERAKKLTEMDLRSPTFQVKVTLFVTLIKLAAKKTCTSNSNNIIEPKELQKAIASLCTCVDEHRIGGGGGGGSKSTNAGLERRAREETYRKIFGQLVSRIMSIFKTTGAAQLVLAKTPPPSTSPADMFPMSDTRTMKSSRACHNSWDFLLILTGRPSSRGASIVARGKKSRRKKKSSKNTITIGEQKHPSAPTSPLGLSNLPASPLSGSPVALPNDFDYFGGSSISTARMPLHPEKNKAMMKVIRGGSVDGDGKNNEKGNATGLSPSSKQIQTMERRVVTLESQLMEARALNGRLMLQSKLVEESPESAALALDSRRLMAAEAKNFQLERQRDVLLSALEGQQQVVDHSERILLELSEMAAQKLLPKKSRGRENIGQRVQNLLERLRASSRASRRARMANLEQ